MKTVLALAAITLVVTGCSGSAPTTETKIDTTAPAGASGASGAASAVKRYPMHGKVLAVNATEKSARIDAGPIGDWMGAMTMNYSFKDPADLAKLKAGADIDATVFVQGDDFWVGDVK